MSRKFQDENEPPQKKSRIIGPIKPLSYQGLRTILQCLNAEKRISLVQHCPSIRAVEKKVPLKINKLELADFKTVVNRTSYRVYTNEECAHWIRDPRGAFRSDDIGLHYDVDHYCLPVVPKDLNLTSGDIFFKSPLPEIEWARQTCIEEREKRLESIEQDFSKRFPSPRWDPPCVLNYAQLKEAVRLGKEWMACFKANKALENPCKRYVTLTINEGLRGTKPIKNGIKLSQAIKRLNQFILGGRAQLIYVDRLIFNEDPRDLQILRLPECLKLRVRNLECPEKFYPKILPLIDPDSLPLESVEVNYHDLYKHEIVKTAKKIWITSWLPVEIPSFNNLQCEKMVFDYEFWHRNARIKIVKDLVEGFKPIGTMYTVNSLGKRNPGILEEIRIEFDGKSFGKRGITIPMNEEAQLNVGFEKYEDRGRRSNIRMTMKVVPATRFSRRNI